MLSKLYHRIPAATKTALFIAVLITSLASFPLQGQETPLAWEYQLLDSAPHNPKSFTQGFIKEGDTFYESSGLYGRSFIQRYKQKSSVRANLPKHLFAEGLTLFNNKLYLLTWKEETLLILDKDRLKVLHTLPYSGEGWGLTHNNEHLIMSNGSNLLTFRDPQTFSIMRSLHVKGLTAINELEYVKGVIWANSLNNDHLFAINPNNGCIIGKMNLAKLRLQIVRPSANNVLNGIAYDKEADALWITGKFWPARYLIQLPYIAANQLTSDPCL